MKIPGPGSYKKRSEGYALISGSLDKEFLRNDLLNDLDGCPRVTFPIKIAQRLNKRYKHC